MEKINKLREVLKQQKKPLSISEIARKANISRITATRYLDQMYLSGQVRLFEMGKAKKYLISSETSLHPLCDLSSDFILTLDNDFRILYVNEAYLRFSNLTRNSVIGKRIDALHLDIFASINILNLLQNFHGKDLEYHTMEVSHDNENFFFDITLAKVRITSLNLAIAIVIKDVTAERRWDKERRFLASVVASSRDAIIGLAPDFSIKTWNYGAEQIFGYPAEEVIGKPVSILKPGDDSMKPFLPDWIQHDKGIIPYECKRRRRDGSLIDVSLTGSYVYNEDKKPIGSSLIIRDITEKKRYETDIEEKYLLLQDMMNVISEPVLLINSDLCISHANYATSHRYHVPMEILIGSSLQEILPPDLYYKRVNYLQKAWITEKPLFFEDREGGRFVENYVYPLFTQGTWDKNWVIMSIDVTRRKMMELRIREINEQYKTILDGIDSIIAVTDYFSHEILLVNEYGRKIFGDRENQQCWFKKNRHRRCKACKICSELAMNRYDNTKEYSFDYHYNQRRYACMFSIIDWNYGKKAVLMRLVDITNTFEIF